MNFSDKRDELAALAETILADLADETWLTRFRLGVQHSRDDASAHWFDVSLSIDDSVRIIAVPIAKIGEHHSSSLVWAAFVIADDLQDEVTEQLHTATPVCEGHSHPMRVRTSNAATWWQCPSDKNRRKQIVAITAES